MNTKTIPDEKLRIFLDILNLMRTLDPEFPLQYAICLSEIALEEGMSLTQLSQRTGLALSTVSRIVGSLSQYRQNGAPYGLVEIRTSPQERRRKELMLSDKGRAFMAELDAALSASGPGGRETSPARAAS